MSTAIAYDENGWLACDGVLLAELAGEYQTPLYVYGRRSLLDRARSAVSAARLADPQALICYSVKANGNISLIRLLADVGMGADVTSAGELFLAQQAGIPPHLIIFSGVGKREDEIEMALNAGIRALHIESAMEFDRIAAMATRRKQQVRIGIRVNPDVGANTHAHITTGKKQHKFGVAPELAMKLLQRAVKHPWLQPQGLAAHIGSQIRDLPPFAASAAVLVELAKQAGAEGIHLEYLDVGGGLGIPYGQEAPALSEWVAAAARPVVKAGFHLIMEPGRSIVGPAGLLLTTVLYMKDAGERRFAIVDAGMTDLIRPALYQASHPVMACRLEPDRPSELVDIAGPVCESTDVLARSQLLPALRPGDLLAITDAGAYGFAMSSNYNGRLRPAELLVGDDEVRLIRKRQTLQDLLH